MLYTELCIYNLVPTFEVVYTGNNFKIACRKLIDALVKYYGHKGGCEIIPRHEENKPIEIAIGFKKRIIAYIGQNTVNEKGLYMTIVKKSEVQEEVNKHEL